LVEENANSRDEPNNGYAATQEDKVKLALSSSAVQRESTAELSGEESDYMPSIRDRVTDHVTLKVPDDDIQYQPLPNSDTAFVPILRLAKFPYIPHYIPKEHSENVAAKFFNQQKFWNRQWNLYVCMIDWRLF